jgi:hypothetical protein
MKGHIRRSSGMTLVAALMLIVFVTYAVFGVTVFIVQRLSRAGVDEVNMQSSYLAQAGIQSALYQFRYKDISANGYFSLGRTDIDADNSFTLGANAADLLMVRTNGSYLYPSTGALASRYRYLYGLAIQNATNSNTVPVVIDRMIVTWNNSVRLRTIRINNSNVWTGNVSSPADCNITNFTLNTTPSIYNVNYLYFYGNMTGSTINITFMMTDGSSKQVTVFPASANYNLTVKSTGKTSGSNIYRTLQADYNALTGKITKLDEINAQM